MDLFLKLRKTVCLAVAGLVACAGACGEKGIPLDSRHGIADQSLLYGMCYLMEERSAESLDIEKEVELMKNLGVRTVRQWMHFTHFMSSPATLKENNAATENMHALLAECEKAGMVNIGMNHHNFCTTKSKSSTTAKPFARDVSEGSDYVQWLNDYYTSWKTLVGEFPEVLYWEIDNEVNNPDFMTDGGEKGSSAYSVRQMAEIATDMFYYATRAIHDANPEAQSVMGGLTEPLGLGNSNLENSRPSNAWFLQAIYDNIFSGEFGYFYSSETSNTASLDPDDYFDILSWHPYVWNKEALDEDFFVEENNKTYQVALDNEGKHKKVFITEVGFSDFSRGEKVVAESTKRMYHAISTRMPYVETLNVFKMYDSAAPSFDGSAADNGYSRYGFFYDPDPARVYYKLDGENPVTVTDELCVPGAPKPLAYVFQEMAGGKGSLELMKNYYRNKG